MDTTFVDPPGQDRPALGDDVGATPLVADGPSVIAAATAPLAAAEEESAHLAACVKLIDATRDVVAGLRTRVGLASGDELTACLASLGELVLAADAAEVAVTTEAIMQGTHLAGQVPQPPAGWVAMTSRRYAAGPGAARVVKLAEAVRPATITRKAGILAADSEGAVLGEAILDGSVPVATGALALAEMTRLSPDLQDPVKPMVWAGYTGIAASGDATQVRRFREAVYANFGSPQRQRKDAATAKAHAGLTAGIEAGDGLSEYRLRLDNEGAAVLEAALDSLSKPIPAEDGTPDPRAWATRRADALIELVKRAVGASGSVPAQPTTQLNVTIKLDDLVNGTGPACCIGGLDAGRFLIADIARRLSCDGAIAPIVLDADGNIVLIGRTKRLFTRDQIRALHVRDEHCTFPGCQRPAGWTDAHHLLHWLDDGETELDNAALLCSFHHHVVHSRRLAGRVTTGPPGSPDEHRLRVVSDLTPGSYDQLLAEHAARRRASADRAPA